MAEEPESARERLKLVDGGRREPADARRPAPAPADGPTVRVRVAAVTDRCWQCRTKVRAVVGVLVDPALSADGSGFVPFDLVAADLAAALDARALAGRGLGPLRHRHSPGVAGGYLANGCLECDALIGRFQLEDLLHEHLQGGGTLSQLDLGLAVELPASARLGLRVARP
jgi:hypothetical protein